MSGFSLSCGEKQLNLYHPDDVSSSPVVGMEVKAGQPIGYVQTYYGMEELIPAVDGRIVSVCVRQGGYVAKGETVAFVTAPF